MNAKEESIQLDHAPTIADSARPPTVLSSEPLTPKLTAAGFIIAWGTVSIAVILSNKQILSYTPFSYPILLTTLHMLVSSGISVVLVKTRRVDPPPIDGAVFVEVILPLSGLFALSLWLSNYAVVLLDVSLIQLLKATTTIAVYLMGLVALFETFDGINFACIVAISGGVSLGVGLTTGSGGLPVGVIAGLVAQLGGVVAEAARLCLVQVLLQKRGLKLNPITSLYYIGPPTACLLLLPFTAIELRRFVADERLVFNVSMCMLLATNCGLAFGLNVALVALINHTSALTLNIAGVVKDAVTILLSSVVFAAPLSLQLLAGWGIAAAGIFVFNYRKGASKEKDVAPSDTC